MVVLKKLLLSSCAIAVGNGDLEVDTDVLSVTTETEGAINEIIVELYKENIDLLTFNC